MNNTPNNKKDILLAEILGDTGKILQDCEDLSKLIPKISAEYTQEMKILFENWQKNATIENSNIINNHIPQFQKEVKDIIKSEISDIVKTSIHTQTNKIEVHIKNSLSKYIYFSIAACSAFFLLGLLIGKFS